MKKISDVIQIIIFTVITFGFMIAIFVVPDKDFSRQENRTLAQAPKFSTEALKSGELMKEIELYLTDQFPLRDTWISMKSYTEKLSGKTENNNVYLGKENVLIKKFVYPKENMVEKNTDAVNHLIANTDIPVYFSLIPGAVSIWEDKLPANAPTYPQKEIIDRVYAKVNCTTIDNYSVLKEHGEEYIYYKTDHHWTTLGAYYGYTALAKGLEIEPKGREEYNVETVSDEFYGTIYSSSGVRWVEPDVIWKYVSEEGKTVQKIAGKETIPGSFYDYEKLEIKDKYTFFFGGNTALLKITSDCHNGKKLLVIRDSYSDSEIPFLTDHFSEIYMMDLRYYKFGVSNFLKENKVDAVLINYSVDNFCEDVNVVMIAG